MRPMATQGLAVGVRLPAEHALPVQTVQPNRAMFFSKLLRTSVVCTVLAVVAAVGVVVVGVAKRRGAVRDGPCKCPSAGFVVTVLGARTLVAVVGVAFVVRRRLP